MNEDKIGYAKLIDDALRDVVRRVLLKVQESGLPGEHHLFITFKSTFTGVQISEKLKQRYPGEMTIVLQHQFWDLSVNRDSFSVTLSFHGVHENLLVPYAALTSFVDPSIRFGLQFQSDEDEMDFSDEIMDEDPFGDQDIEGEKPAKEVPGSADGAKIISLDSFRKK